MNGPKSTWIDTFYFKRPYSLNNMEAGVFEISKNVRAKYFDLAFDFHFIRTSESHFKIYVIRHYPTIAAGKYTIEFLCDINVFDEEPKTIKMPYNKFTADAEYIYKLSDSKNASSDKLQQEFEFVILIRLIEYDDVQSLLLSNKAEQFRSQYPIIYSNESLKTNLCDILNILKLEDIFIGRMNMDFIDKKLSFIKSIAELLLITGAITNYWRARKESSTEPFEEMERLPFILSYILHGKIISISDADLREIYIEAHYLGLEFLILLSRDCILHRLSLCKTLIFDVLNPAVQVNDASLLQGAVNEIFSFDNDYEKLKDKGTGPFFVLYSLRRIWKELLLRTGSRHEEASTSRVQEL